MFIQVVKSKIHRVKITHADLHYIGSITIDPALMSAANLVAGEKVQVLNVSNGKRLETYVIESKAGSKDICIYGAAAHLIQTGQRIIILSYASINKKDVEKFQPKVLYLDKNNTILD